METKPIEFTVFSPDIADKKQPSSADDGNAADREEQVLGRKELYRETVAKRVRNAAPSSLKGSWKQLLTLRVDGLAHAIHGVKATARIWVQ